MYGDATGSPLHGSIATDRLVVSWDLTRDDATRTAPADEPSAHAADPLDRDGDPSRAARRDESRVRVVIPHDVHSIDLEDRAAWSSTTRESWLTRTC